MKSLPFSLFLTLKILIGIVWVVLFVLLLRRDVFLSTLDPKELQSLKQAETEEYQSIYFKNSKIGYVSSRYSQLPENGWLLEQQAQMRLNVAETMQIIELRLAANISSDNLLNRFELSFRSPFYQMQAAGTVDGNRVDYMLTTATTSIRDSLSFTAPPLLATSRRAYLLGSNMQQGKKRIVWFDPVSLTGKESVLEYKGKEPILINGRVQSLHHFSELFGGVRVNSWLNDSGAVVKEESPAGFIFIREPKFKALQLVDSSQDLLSAFAVKVEGKMPDLTDDNVRYRLRFPKETVFDLHGGRQTFQHDILTITRETIPVGSPHADCPNMEESLAATAYIQSADKDIRELASRLTGDLATPYEKVRQLAAWVYENIDKRPVLGLPDALSTLKSRKGDCNEHAALFAALARSADIPAKIAAGVTFNDNAFYYHAWNEVCLGGKWITIDTAMNQIPADLTHLRFVQGEMEEQARISSLLGRLGIETLKP